MTVAQISILELEDEIVGEAFVLQI